MALIFAALAVYFAGAVSALFLGRTRAAGIAGTAAAVLGGGLGLAGLGLVLPGLMAGRALPSLALAWQLPGMRLILGLDGLSAAFLAPVFLLGALCALSGHASQAHDHDPPHPGAQGAFFNLTLAALTLTYLARDGLLFLIAWEVMSLSPFFLIVTRDREESVRAAGWSYLIASHLGAALIALAVILLGRESGSLTFAAFAGLHGLSPALAGTVFLLGLAGFGAKAGFAPLHVWLPEAHPAAPSHVSAFLSGVLIKAGIYGVMRLTTFLGPPAGWWGLACMGIGLLTGVWGVLAALGQRDVKRLLAYSSVENIGIILLGLGLGLSGTAQRLPGLALLGYGGALLHMLNHGLIKSLLFLSAGAVLHSTGSLDQSRLGGLAARMPVTGAAFFLGALAICGLPPLNGFTGELLLYLAAAANTAGDGFSHDVSVLGAVTGLAFLGALSLAAFGRGFGAAFLGEPRSEAGRAAHDPSATERAVLVALVLLCLGASLAAPSLFSALLPAVAQLMGKGGAAAEELAPMASLPLAYTALSACCVFLAMVILYKLRERLLFNRPIRGAATWGCGYTAATPRIQYSGGSFVQPLTSQARDFTGHHPVIHRPLGLFPRASSVHVLTPERGVSWLFRPLFQGLESLCNALKFLQHGKAHLYILYILVALVLALAWRGQ